MKVRSPKSEVGKAETQKLRKGGWELGTQEIRNREGLTIWSRHDVSRSHRSAGLRPGAFVRRAWASSCRAGGRRSVDFLFGFPEFLSSKFSNSISEFLSFGLAHFGFRASDFFRISGFGFRILLPAVPSSALALDTNKIPDLRPPLTEIPPTFWEAHGWTVVISSVISVIVLVPLIRALLRLLVPQPIPPATLARQALEALQGRPDDAATASEVAQHLRRFTQATLNLPPGELTTEELLAALRRQPSAPPISGAGAPPATVLRAPRPQNPPPVGETPTPLAPELHDALARLLRDCDALHFAPVTPAISPGFAARALEIVRQIESQIQKVPSQSEAVPEPAGHSQRA